MPSGVPQLRFTHLGQVVWDSPFRTRDRRETSLLRGRLGVDHSDSRSAALISLFSFMSDVAGLFHRFRASPAFVLRRFGGCRPGFRVWMSVRVLLVGWWSTTCLTRRRRP